MTTLPVGEAPTFAVIDRIRNLAKDNQGNIAIPVDLRYEDVNRLPCRSNDYSSKRHGGWGLCRALARWQVESQGHIWQQRLFARSLQSGSVLDLLGSLLIIYGHIPALGNRPALGHRRPMQQIRSMSVRVLMCGGS